MDEIKQLTKEEILEDSRLNKIKEALTKIADLCNTEPRASIICSISIPSADPDAGGVLISRYNGESAMQVNQLNLLVKTNKAFENDLILFLEDQIRTKIKKSGSMSDPLIDQMLNMLDKNDTKH